MESVELLGMSEAARRLRVHLSTLRRWSEAGVVRHVRDSGNRRIFFGNDVDKLVRDREQVEASK